jgi:hypothetical protein
LPLELIIVNNSDAVCCKRAPTRKKCHRGGKVDNDQDAWALSYGKMFA